MIAAHRALARSETGFATPSPTTVGWETSLRGDLDADALIAAFAALRKDRPYLTATIEMRNGTPNFVTGHEHRPECGGCVRLDRSAVLPERPAAEPGIDIGHALSALRIRSNGHEHRVVIAGAHAIADGTHMYALLQELWTNYAHIASGADRTIGRESTARPFPRPSESIPLEIDGQHDGSETYAESTGIERIDDVEWWGSYPTIHPSIDGGRELGPLWPDVTTLRFSRTVTTALERLARTDGGPGFSGLVGAILLVSERAGFAESAAKPIRMGAMTLADVRRLGGLAGPSRPVGPTCVTNLVGPSYAAVDLTADSDPFAVGRHLSTTLRADISAGRCALAMREHRERPAGAHPPVVLSNLGRIAVPALPGDLVVDDVRACMSVDAHAFAALGSVDSANPAHSGSPSPAATVYQFSTFDGRLAIDAINLAGTTTAHEREMVTARTAELIGHLTSPLSRGHSRPTALIA